MSSPLPWLPTDFGPAFGISLLALACWGTWSNTAKAAAARSVPFSHYYADFSVAILVMAALLWGTLGGAQFAASSDPSASVGAAQVVAAACAGTVFNVANLLLVVAVQVAGLSLAFPVGIGTALVLGTVLTYVIDIKGDPALLFAGVALGLMAILLNAAAYYVKDAGASAPTSASKRKISSRSSSSNSGGGGGGGGGRVYHEERIALLGGQSDSSSTAKGGVSAVISYSGSRGEEGNGDSHEQQQQGEEKSSIMSRRRQLTLCAVSGILMAGWSPLSAYSMQENGDDGDGAMSAYASFLIFAAALPVTTPILLWLQLRGLLPRGVDGTTMAGGQSGGSRQTRAGGSCGGSGLLGWVQSAPSSHVWGIVGGAVWAIGTLSNLVAGDAIGLALSYAIGQSAPMVAALWGIFYYREFSSAPWLALALLFAMFAFFGAAVAVIALGGS